MAGGEWGARAGGHRPSRSWQALLTPLWAQRRADATSAQGFDATALRTRALSPGRRCRILCWRLSLSSSVIVSPSRCRRRARKRSTIPPHPECSRPMRGRRRGIGHISRLRIICERVAHYVSPTVAYHSGRAALRYPEGAPRPESAAATGATAGIPDHTGHRQAGGARRGDDRPRSARAVVSTRTVVRGPAAGSPRRAARAGRGRCSGRSIRPRATRVPRPRIGRRLTVWRELPTASGPAIAVKRRQNQEARTALSTMPSCSRRPIEARNAWASDR
jgi:hypothetical protein